MLSTPGEDEYSHINDRSREMIQKPPYTSSHRNSAETTRYANCNGTDNHCEEDLFSSCSEDPSPTMSLQETFSTSDSTNYQDKRPSTEPCDQKSLHDGFPTGDDDEQEYYKARLSEILQESGICETQCGADWTRPAQQGDSYFLPKLQAILEKDLHLSRSDFEKVVQKDTSNVQQPTWALFRSWWKTRFRMIGTGYHECEKEEYSKAKSELGLLVDFKTFQAWSRKDQQAMQEALLWVKESVKAWKGYTEKDVLEVLKESVNTSLDEADRVYALLDTSARPVLLKKTMHRDYPECRLAVTKRTFHEEEPFSGCIAPSDVDSDEFYDQRYFTLTWKKEKVQQRFCGIQVGHLVIESKQSDIVVAVGIDPDKSQSTGLYIINPQRLQNKDEQDYQDEKQYRATNGHLNKLFSGSFYAQINLEHQELSVDCEKEQYDVTVGRLEQSSECR